MRIKLNEKYIDEREKICDEIINILELDFDGCFLLSEIDVNIDKQNKILELKDKIKKYFAVSTISSFKPNFKCKRPYLNIIRSILRQQNYIFEGKDFEFKIDENIFKRTIKYKIFRNK
jgi:hypothetical protein